MEHEGTYSDTVLLLKVFIFHLSQWTQTKKVFVRCFEFSPEMKFDKAALATDDCRKYIARLTKKLSIKIIINAILLMVLAVYGLVIFLANISVKQRIGPFRHSYANLKQLPSIENKICCKEISMAQIKQKC